MRRISVVLLTFGIDKLVFNAPPQPDALGLLSIGFRSRLAAVIRGNCFNPRHPCSILL